jgi:hypothetical protein
MNQFRQVLTGAVTFALMLSVPALAVCVFASSPATTQTVAIQPGDDPVGNGLLHLKSLAVSQQPTAQAKTRPAKAGQTPVEVEAQDWVATGGGSGPGGSPKG